MGLYYDGLMIKRTILALLLLWSLAAVLAAETADPRRLRIVTYNIHHGEAMDGRFDYERLARVINDLRPDVVALQEVDRGTARARGVDQAAILAKLTGLEAVYGRALYHQGGEYGQTVLSRFSVGESWNVPLPFRSETEPRAALAVKLQPGNGLPEFWLVDTHLCHLREEVRLDQVEYLHRFASSLGEAPVVIAGDLNSRPQSPPIAYLAERGWLDAVAPDSRIDYVLIRKSDSWRIAEHRVVENDVVSDHDPVLTVLEWVQH